MASIRSVEGRSGALRAASAKRLKASAYKKTYDSAKKQMGGAAPYVPATAQTYAKTVAANPQFAKTVNKDIQQDAKSIAYKSTYDSAKAQMGGKAPYVPATTDTYARYSKEAEAQNAASRAAAPTVSTYRAPTSATRTSTAPTAKTTTTTSSTPKVATSAPAPKPTTSTGKGAAISAIRSRGKSRGAMRGNRKSKRDNPRAARSTTIDELKKQAARSLGI